MRQFYLTKPVGDIFNKHMKFGKHKGRAYGAVPYTYLFWLCHQEWFKPKNNPELVGFILERKEAIWKAGEKARWWSPEIKSVLKEPKQKEHKKE